MRAALLLACFVTVALAQEYDVLHHVAIPYERGQIRLRTATINVRSAAPHHAETRDVTDWIARTAGEAGAHLYMVHVAHPIDDAYRASLERALDVPLTTYLPHNTFLVPLSAEAAARAQTLAGVDWVGVYRPAYKTAPEVHALSFDDEERVNQADLVAVWMGAGQATPDYQAMAEARFDNTDFAVQVTVASTRKLGVSVRSRAAGQGVTRAAVVAVAHWLAERPLVHWIEPKAEFVPLNKWARPVTQSGFEMTTPITSIRNLTGQGQVVGVADTGLDVSSCFFNDPNHPVPFNTVSSDHRKIVTYITLVDDTDDFSGHGTHVCGSVAGEVAHQPQDVTDSSSPFNGQAFGAKLAFTDIGESGQDGLRTPLDLNTDFFPAPYAAGARIHSNSWGSATPNPRYDSESMNIDQFMWDHQDFLALFAAGNDGDQGVSSLCSPGTAKSSISVGASVNSYESWGYYYSLTKIYVNITSPTPNAGRRIANLAGWAPSFYQPVNGSLIAAVPANGCTPFSNAADVAGKIVVIRLSLTACTPITLAVNARAAGALAAIIISNDTRIGNVNGEPDTNNQIPTVVLSPANGADINNFLANAVHIEANIWRTEMRNFGASPATQLNDMTGWSSYGPTSDMRFKPDIVAPGQFIFSAKSNGNDSTVQCGEQWVFPSLGTSMATPTLAGNMAVVRQYFTEGYYPTGVKNASNAIIPSGALLKATALASAQYLDGLQQYYSDVGIPGGSLPTQDFDQYKQPAIWAGYGRVQTNTVLRFSDSAFNTFLADVPRSAGLTTGANAMYCFTMVAGEKMTVSLVWTDYPSTPDVLFNIVNNLDLVVAGPNGAVWLGNNLTEVNGGAPLTDILNTAEVAYIKDAAAGSYKVIVRGAHIPMGPQPYALYVTGGFSTQVCPDNDIPCPQGCSSHGTCAATTGLCACAAGWAAADCSQAILPINQTGTRGSVYRYSWDFYNYTVPEGGVGSITLKGENLGNPKVSNVDYYIKAGGVPTVFDYDFADQQPDWLAPNVTVPFTSGPMTAGTAYTIGVFGAHPLSTSYRVSLITEAAPVPAPIVEAPSSSSDHTAAIVGGVVGGAAGLALIIGVTCLLCHKTKKPTKVVSNIQSGSASAAASASASASASSSNGLSGSVSAASGAASAASRSASASASASGSGAASAISASVASGSASGGSVSSSAV